MQEKIDTANIPVLPIPKTIEPPIFAGQEEGTDTSQQIMEEDKPQAES